MAEKLSDKLKGLFKRADTYLGKAIERKPKSSTSMGPSQTQYKMFKAGQKTKNLMKGLSLTKKLDKPASASKALITASAAKKARTIGKLKTIGRVASRAALPVAAGFEAANLAYKVATLSPEKKAKIKKLKTELSKKSTKQSHADLLKMSTGGDTMLQNPKKADLDKDGKLSGYEKKRAKAIESNMKQKPIKAVLGIATMGLLGAKMLSDKKKKKAAKAVSPVAMLNDLKEEDKNQVTTGQQQASKGKMMKARYGTMAKGNVKEGLKKSNAFKSKLETFRNNSIKKLRGAQVGPAEEAKLVSMMPNIKDSPDTMKAKKEAIKTKLSKLNKAKSGKIMKAYKGAEAKGYGAARTQGQGLQDENLIPGKSLDYYKDIM